jgi:hypothetical protein
VLAAYRPTGEGRVERQVAISRDHVLAGPTFAPLAELEAAPTSRPSPERNSHSTLEKDLPLF